MALQRSTQNNHGRSQTVEDNSKEVLQDQIKYTMTACTVGGASIMMGITSGALTILTLLFSVQTDLTKASTGIWAGCFVTTAGILNMWTNQPGVSNQTKKWICIADIVAAVASTLQFILYTINVQLTYDSIIKSQFTEQQPTELLKIHKFAMVSLALLGISQCVCSTVLGFLSYKAAELKVIRQFRQSVRRSFRRLRRPQDQEQSENQNPNSNGQRMGRPQNANTIPENQSRNHARRNQPIAQQQGIVNTVNSHVQNVHYASRGQRENDGEVYIGQPSQTPITYQQPAPPKYSQSQNTRAYVNHPQPQRFSNYPPNPNQHHSPPPYTSSQGYI